MLYDVFRIKKCVVKSWKLPIISLIFNASNGGKKSWKKWTI